MSSIQLVASSCHLILDPSELRQLERESILMTLLNKGMLTGSSDKHSLLVVMRRNKEKRSKDHIIGQVNKENDKET